MQQIKDHKGQFCVARRDTPEEDSSGMPDSAPFEPGIDFDTKANNPRTSRD